MTAEKLTAAVYIDKNIAHARELYLLSDKNRENFDFAFFTDNKNNKWGELDSLDDIEVIEIVEISPRITVDEKVRFGKPVVKGTRVPVNLILGKLAGGMTVEEVLEVLEEYQIARDDVKAVLGYASKVLGQAGNFYLRTEEWRCE